MAPTRREKLGQVVTAAGMAAALPSVWQTVTHITDDTYRAPEVRDGAGHVQYHMAREALVTAGSLAAIGIGVLAGPRRGRPLWGAMAAAGAGFAAAMWSGGPTTGVWAPNEKALAVHIASTTGLATGIWLLHPERGSR
ncbi:MULTISPECIES: hypothetical protein [unclassified Streptomyces]|uniref:hypothetical protein n=1 Tax=unclassified Streptomyces TaxID=2593676 RepID=UPI00088F56C9|nr:MULTISPECIES: hypothetical protein [unclassified Streptomyces]PBC86917.1 hypothetical protein BX261_7035 [Streptomyces sp. 2321.6]SDQ67982.1 hypothetical protein SAMN05216511_0215 [Streptomyces sp. KS_16]SEE13536.1 hypothetical protein SAMN05428940_7060 [Streptomyces sp. 2133.1]SNC74094.1 hypothetical protein SAMN06272741_6965 [Streptomyces sp. 2114.4]